MRQRALQNIELGGVFLLGTYIPLGTKRIKEVSD